MWQKRSRKLVEAAVVEVAAEAEDAVTEFRATTQTLVAETATTTKAPRSLIPYASLS